MKNWKKYAAIIGAAMLLIIFCLPMYFALKGDFSMKSLMASLFTVMFVAIMGYVMLMMFRVLNKKNNTQTKNCRIKNIIFDMGNVLVDYDWKSYLKTYEFDEDKSNKIAEATFLSQTWVEMDRGGRTFEEYLDEFVSYAPEYESDIRKVVQDSWKCIHRKPYAETWIKYLKQKGYDLYVLSNYGEYMREHTRREMPFLKNMDGSVFSCDVNQVKPEAEIYHTLLDRYQLNPEESVFMDDMEVNCRAAAELGIHAICFKSFKQAAAELEELGIK